MGVGGAQRVMGHLVSHLSTRHEVTLFTYERAGSVQFWTVPNSTRIVQTNLLGKAGWLDRAMRILARFAVIRREIQKFQPHVVLSFMDVMNITVIVAARGSGVPIVISERVDPSQHRIGVLRGLLRRCLYPLADCCVVQTERAKQFFNWARSSQLAVIPNPVPISAQCAELSLRNSQGKYRIIAMGRLEHQKGFDLLLDAFAQLAPSFPQWELVIFGEGSAREALEAQIAHHNMTKHVRLPGITANPTAELAASHIMAFPSRYEGFPNALAEGLAAGLPAIGYAGVSGVEELIVNEETGLLIHLPGAAPALAHAMRRLIEDQAFRRKLGLQAKRHMERWRLEIVCEQWETCLVTTVKKKAERNSATPIS